MEWDNKIQVHKGNYGEQIFDAILKKQNYNYFEPGNDGAHKIDRLVSPPDSKLMYWIEIKTNSHRMHYPDNGILLRHHNDYLTVEKTSGHGVALYFVDSKSKMIYGNALTELIKPYSTIHKGRILTYPLISKTGYGEFIYYPLANTLNISKLTDDQVNELNKRSSIRSDYRGSNQ